MICSALNVLFSTSFVESLSGYTLRERAVALTAVFICALISAGVSETTYVSNPPLRSSGLLKYLNVAPLVCVLISDMNSVFKTIPPVTDVFPLTDTRVKSSNMIKKF